MAVHIKQQNTYVLIFSLTVKKFGVLPEHSREVFTLKFLYTFNIIITTPHSVLLS